MKNKQEMLDAWVSFYDSFIKGENEKIDPNDVDFGNMALGFFAAKGATIEEAFDLYHTECIQLGKF